MIDDARIAELKNYAINYPGSFYKAITGEDVLGLIARVEAGEAHYQRFAESAIARGNAGKVDMSEPGPAPAVPHPETLGDRIAEIAEHYPDHLQWGKDLRAAVIALRSTSPQHDAPDFDKIKVMLRYDTAVAFAAGFRKALGEYDIDTGSYTVEGDFDSANVVPYATEYAKQHDPARYFDAALASHPVQPETYEKSLIRAQAAADAYSGKNMNQRVNFIDGFLAACAAHPVHHDADALTPDEIADLDSVIAEMEGGKAGYCLGRPEILGLLKRVRALRSADPKPCGHMHTCTCKFDSKGDVRTLTPMLDQVADLIEPSIFTHPHDPRSVRRGMAMSVARDVMALFTPSEAKP